MLLFDKIPILYVERVNKEKGKRGAEERHNYLQRKQTESRVIITMHGR